MSVFRNLEETVLEMLAVFWVKSGVRPDSEPGSVLRTLFEAVGFELEDMSYRFDQGVTQAIPEAVYDAFGFEILGARRATVALAFERTVQAAVLTIPQGFRVSRLDGEEFETLEPRVIAPGQTTVVSPAVAVRAGERGNSLANTITRARASLPTLLGVTNPSAATGGQDAESTDERRRRFALYIATVQRATVASVAAAALLAETDQGERPDGVKVEDNVADSSLVPGHVRVYVDDGFGTTSSALLAAVEASVDRVRAAGAYLEVRAVTPRLVAVVATITTATALWDEVRTACERAAERYLKSLGIGEKLSYENLITALTTAHEGVLEVTLLQPASDISVSRSERNVLQSVNITRPKGLPDGRSTG